MPSWFGSHGLDPFFFVCLVVCCPALPVCHLDAEAMFGEELVEEPPSRAKDYVEELEAETGEQHVAIGLYVWVHACACSCVRACACVHV